VEEEFDVELLVLLLVEEDTEVLVEEDVELVVDEFVPVVVEVESFSLSDSDPVKDVLSYSSAK
jgi:hypothetical protein